MKEQLFQHLSDEIQSLHATGLYKAERCITSPQSAAIKISTGEEVINFCANNYLGLSSHPVLVLASAQRPCEKHDLIGNRPSGSDLQGPRVVLLPIRLSSSTTR